SLVAYLHGVQVVGGSNPLAPTKEIKALQAMLVRPFSISEATSESLAKRARPAPPENHHSGADSKKA
ncbi:MAG: hypothetical protein ACN6PY_01380, partial [Paraburkholderia nemoris]